MRPLKLLASVLVFGAASLVASGARATDCTTLPNSIYVVGSTAIGPVVNTISKYLAVQTTSPVTIIYDASGSCAGVTSMVNVVANPGLAGLTSGTKTGVFSYFDSSGMPQKCDIEPPDGGVSTVLPNVAMSDVFAQSCQMLPNGLPTGVVENLGPVQAMTFDVPAMSPASSISAEAAYFVYGFGNASGIKQWSDVNSIFQRGATSGTQTMIANAIQVLPTTAWYGVTPSGTSGMIMDLITANSAENAAAIGILGTADIDPVRRAGSASSAAAIKELAYQHKGQNCGYLPDSSPTSYDKLNVRNGHYAIWGHLHVFTLPTGTSAQVQNAATFVGYLTGLMQTGSLDVIAAEAVAGVVPTCAMRVQRTTEMGPLTPASGSGVTPCGCYFEQAADGSTSCKSCKSQTDCGNNQICPMYNGQGWCETQF